MEDENTGINTPDLPETLAGPRNASETDGDPTEAARRIIADGWRKADHPARKAFLRKQGITPAEVTAYLDGTGHIPFPKQTAMRSTALTMMGATQ